MSLEEEQEQKRQDAERKRIAAQSISEVEDWQDKKSLEEGFFELAKESFKRGIQGVLTSEPRMMSEGFTAGILFLALKLAELGTKVTYKVLKDTIKVTLEAQSLSKRNLNKINENLSNTRFIEKSNDLMRNLSDDLKSKFAEKGVDFREILLQVALEGLEKSQKLSDKPPTYEQATGKKAMRVLLPNEKYSTELPQEKYFAAKDTLMRVLLPEKESFITQKNTTNENNLNKISDKETKGKTMKLSSTLKNSSFDNRLNIPFSELENVIRAKEERIKKLKTSFAKDKLNKFNQSSL